jgi:hypothetical protein
MAKQPLDQLREYAKKCDGAKLDELLQMGKDVKGVTFFNLGEILEYMQQNHEQARSMVALTAIAYLSSGKSHNYVPGLHLGMLTMIYLGTFQNDPTFGQDCIQFHNLLKACINDLGRLEAEFMRQFDKQF